jgi:hypothetical protein
MAERASATNPCTLALLHQPSSSAVLPLASPGPLCPSEHRLDGIWCPSVCPQLCQCARHLRCASTSCHSLFRQMQPAASHPGLPLSVCFQLLPTRNPHPALSFPAARHQTPPSMILTIFTCQHPCCRFFGQHLPCRHAVRREKRKMLSIFQHDGFIDHSQYLFLQCSHSLGLHMHIASPPPSLSISHPTKVTSSQKAS